MPSNPSPERPSLIEAAETLQEMADTFAQVVGDGSRWLGVIIYDSTIEALRAGAGAIQRAEQAEQELARLQGELTKETARRKFMQMYGRHLGWGYIGPDEHPLDWKNPDNIGVLFTGDPWLRPYQRHTTGVSYVSCSGDREEAERRVIDKAIAEYEAAVQLSGAERSGEQHGGDFAGRGVDRAQMDAHHEP